MSKDSNYGPILGKTTGDLIRSALENSMDYSDYRVLMGKLVSQNRSTGNDQSDPFVEYTKLNDKRMGRLDKTLKLDPENAGRIAGLGQRITWLVLTESWCGDAAQSLPVMNLIAKANPNLGLRIALRDENNALMDRFLFNGTRSIPRLIAINAKDEVMGVWGPRPQEATEMTVQEKKRHGKLTIEFRHELQNWYNKDRGKAIQGELVGLLLK